MRTVPPSSELKSEYDLFEAMDELPDYSLILLNDFAPDTR